MDNEIISKRQLLIMLAFVVGAFIFFCIQLILPKKAKLVVCDVGQGDGMYLRTQEGVNIIVDAGPGPQIMECLGHEMRFFDKTIDIAFLTNPQKDHFGGFNYMFGHYTIKHFIGSPLAYDSPDFRSLEKRLLKKGIPLSVLYKGSVVNVGKYAKITFLWPTEEYVRDHTSGDSAQNEPEMNIFERLSLLKKHLELWEATWHNSKNFNVMKKYIKIYIKDFNGASEMRAELMNAKTMIELQESVQKFTLTHSPQK